MGDVAAVRSRDPAHDREAEPAAARRRTLRETFEQSRHECGLDARTVVVDFQDGVVTVACDAHGDVRARVRACVRDEVAGELRETTLVTTDDCALQADVDGDLRRAGGVWCVARAVAQSVPHDDREIDGLALEVVRTRAAREREQIADKRAAIDRAARDRRERCGIRGVRRARTRTADLRDARDRRERRA